MARAAPEKVFHEAVSSLTVLSESNRKKQQEYFKAADTFQGYKDGFYYTKGPYGLGYYLDLSLDLSRKELPDVSVAVPKKEFKEVPLAVPKKELQDVAPTSQTGELTQKLEPSSDAKLPKVSDPEELLREAEAQLGNDQVPLLDAKGLKRLILGFERKYKENMEARMKYSDQPDKFMESEVDLDEEVRRLQAIAGNPELYPELIRLNAVPPLLNLLSHDNADIAGDVIELLNELTDSDVVEDSEEEAKELVSAIIENNGLELLVQRLMVLDENVEEEASAVFNALGILENMIDVTPEVAEEVVRRTKVLKWLLGRMKPRDFDSNKQAASEVLALLLQTKPDVVTLRLAQNSGIDTCLQVVAPYKNKDPQTDEEEECINNLFNAMCATLMTHEGRNTFVSAEGVELMILILKQKRFARFGSLRTLDYALTKCPAACERFVDTLGLKTLFAIFMGRTKVTIKKREDKQTSAEIEERAVSLISSLFQGLARGSRRDRLAAKFVENEYEKCDRLMEIYSRYTRRVEAEEERLVQLAEEEEEAADPEYQYLARQEAGLYTLQQVALVVGNLWFVGDLGIRKRLLQLLHQQGLTLEGLRDVLKEFHDNIGTEGGEDEAMRARSRVMKMLSALGYKDAAALENGNEAMPEPDLGDAQDTKPEGVAEEDPFNLGDLDELEEDGADIKTYKKERKAEGNGPPDREQLRAKYEDREEERRRQKHKDRDRDREHDRRDRDRDRDREPKEGRDREREKLEKHRDREKDRDRDKDKERSRHKDHKRRRDGDHDREDRKKERHK